MESGSDERLSRASRLLREAEGRVRILRTLSWPLEVEARFFATGGKELPIVAYEPADPTPTLERVEAATRLLDAGDPDHAMLFRHAEAIAHGARMLGAVGTPQFTEHARRIYGTPNEPILDGETTPLALARWRAHFIRPRPLVVGTAHGVVLASRRWRPKKPLVRTIQYSFVFTPYSKGFTMKTRFALAALLVAAVAVEITDLNSTSQTGMNFFLFIKLHGTG